MKKRLKKKKKLQQEIKGLEQEKQLFALACKKQVDIFTKLTEEKQKLIYEIVNLEEVIQWEQVGLGRKRKKNIWQKVMELFQ